MPFYLFNKSANRDELSDIARRLDLKERRWGQYESEWKGNPFRNKNLVLTVYYDRDNTKSPLLINTPTGHSNIEVLGVLQQYIRICEPRAITNQFEEPYQMAEFA